MRLATYRSDARQYYGAVTEEGMIPLSPDFPQWSSLRDVISAGALGTLAIAASGRTAVHAHVQYEPPVPDPEKIICVGVNYPDRSAGYTNAQEMQSEMPLFVRLARSFTGHERPLLRPPESTQLDYAGAIAVVIGKGGRRISQADAYEHIAALTLCNDSTLRDWESRTQLNASQAKNWDCSGAMGPWLVPFNDASQLEHIGLSTRVNGETRQQDRISSMQFSIRRQIEYISTFTTLVPGDIIVTGSPPGAGLRSDPPRFLQPGDLIEVQADGIGRLVNSVELERQTPAIPAS
ncbi:MAG: fumarylacetoacetate hydrolase family protein [Granulosicoccus sp.]|nr:fumarylacetoacetate hydrolase family protein [Granulosicoccus sp.]